MSSSSDFLAGPLRIEQGSAGQHGTGHRKQPIGDTTQGAAVAVTAPAQFGISAAAEFIVLDGDAHPVIDGAAQPHVAGLAHDDNAAFAAAPGHRGDPGQGPQSVIISPAQRLASLGEHRGEDDPSDARQDRRIVTSRCPGLLPRRGLSRAFGELGTESIEIAVRFLDLAVDQLEAGGDCPDMRACRFSGASGHRQRLLPQDPLPLGGCDSTDAVGLKDAFDTTFANASGFGRRRPQLEKPVGREVVRDRQRCG